MNASEIIRVLTSAKIATRIKPESGGWIACSCPFAEWLHPNGRDRTASFGVKVNPDGASIFNCFTCHSKGTLPTLLRRLGEFNGKDYTELISSISQDELPDSFAPWDAERPNTNELSWTPMNVEEFDSVFPHAWTCREARQYLITRRTGPAVSESMDLRYDSYEQRLLFPVWRDGDLIGITGRTIDDRRFPKVRNYHGFHPHSFLLGEQLMNFPDGSNVPLVVVEGQFDLARFHQHKLGAHADCLSLMGSLVTQHQADRLVSFNRPIILMLDDDEAGRDGIATAVRLMHNLIPIIIPDYPTGKTEPDKLSLVEMLSMIGINSRLSDCARSSFRVV